MILVLIPVYLAGLAFTAWLLRVTVPEEDRGLRDVIAGLWPITLPLILVGTVIACVLNLVRR